VLSWNSFINENGHINEEDIKKKLWYKKRVQGEMEKFFDIFNCITGKKKMKRESSDAILKK